MNQQKIVNTLVKTKKLPVTFRIGTRLRGFKTYDTLSKCEFLMVNADYREIRFENILSVSGKNYKALLTKIAKKRLESVTSFSNTELTDIVTILGSVTSEEEALLIVYDVKILTDEELEKYPLKLYLAKKHVGEIRKLLPDTSNKEENLKKLVNRKNPLFDMVNLLLLRRKCKVDKVISMYQAYVSKAEEKPEYHKYKHLYDKNKVALLFQLVSINRPRQKIYAGFYAFCMLFSGIIRNFLELCYQSFNIAIFSDAQGLIKSKKNAI